MAQSHFSAQVYGTIKGQPPFGTGLPGPATIDAWSRSAELSFPAQGVVIHPVFPGFKVGNTYVYSAIQVLPSGLDQYGTKYVSSATAASLATTVG